VSLSPSSAPGAQTPAVDALIAGAIDVVDPAGLERACAACRATGVVVLDTEFERTDTFYARIALVQLWSEGQVWLVDPLRIEDPAPLADLLEDASITKVLHSASEDVEVLHTWTGARLAGLFDTQLAAAFLGERFGIGYGDLVRSVLGVDLAKGETRSNWLARPLSASQHRYACLDVIHLAEIHARQRAQLELTNRLAWLEEDCARVVADALRRPAPEDAWRTVKGAGSLTPRSLAALEDMAAWRERTARELDRPRGHIVRDEHLVLLAERLPEQVATLRGDPLPHGLVKRWGDVLQALLDGARQRPEEALPAPLPPPPTRAENELLRRLRDIAKRRAREIGLAEELLARKRLVEPFVLGSEAVPEAYRGWRWPIVGEQLLAARDRPGAVPGRRS
jgi:ribonuclease D